MGSGKTTLGKKLAKYLSYTFIDLDKTIEEEEGRSIQQIFKEEGETYFREKEREALTKENANRFVMALGGGTPCFYDNMAIINKRGTSIYLKYNQGMLTSRLINSKNRPLIQNKTETELKKFVSHKLKEREAYYNQSNYTIEGNNLKVEDIINLFK